jgi:hypothetical protein
MGIRLSFEIEGDRQIDRTLQRFELGARNAAPAFEKIVDSFVHLEERQFASRGGYAGTPWAPLTPAYAAWKSKHYPGKPILELTGTLVDSLTRRPLGVEVIEAHFAVFGSGTDYGRYLQAGTPRMVARPPVQVPETVRREWVKIMQRWIVEGDRGLT